MTRSNEPVFQPLSTVPRWVLVVAAAAYLAAMGGLLFMFHAHESNPPLLIFQVPFAALMAFFPALWVLVVGLVNVDARRRGMNARFWTLVALFTPNALGVIFYYFYTLRRPLQVPCPGCGASTTAGSQFCPKCGRKLRPGCPACGKPVDEDDAYCPSCGRALASAPTANGSSTPVAS